MLLVLAAGFGLILLLYALALQADQQREDSQRQALREAVEEARPVLGEFPSLEHQALRLLERSSGVKGLKLETDVAAGGGDQQSVVDRKGRIIGWLSFAPDRPLSSFLNRLWPLTAGFLILLGGVAGLLIWQLRKLNIALTHSDRRARSLEKLDQLTGLADHRCVLEQIDHMLAIRKAGQSTVIADFDLDHFKDINDSLGHEIGDDVLAVIGQRLRNSIPPGAVCGRLGGDEFVLAMNVENAEAAKKDLGALLEILDRPAWVSDRAVQLGMSAGIVEAPLHGVARDDLIRRANFALRVAKSRGRNPAHCF